MDKIYYSIIIPHKNIPDLLQRCLDSIPRRKDVQIIVVDDNSDKAIVDFDNFPGLNDPFVEVYFTNKGKGAGYARNVGMDHAKGEWLIFADADDYFTPCLSDILRDYRESEYDIVFLKANSLDSFLYTPAFRCGLANAHIPINSKIDECWLRYLCGEPWGKIIKRQLVVAYNILFDETSIHNDTKFSYLTGFFAKRIYADCRAIYCVTSRGGSLSKQISEEKQLERIYVFANAQYFYETHNLNVEALMFQPYKELAVLFWSNKEGYKKGREILDVLQLRKKNLKLHREIIKELVKKCLHHWGIKKIYKLVIVSRSI